MLQNSLLASFCTIFLASLISASPVAPTSKSQTEFSALSVAQITAFRPYTYYASTAYCKPATTSPWACGANCNANPNFISIASGGDGDHVQFWYVGYDEALKTVIVAHQGTDIKKIHALITDVKVPKKTLSKKLYPGLPSSIQVHQGFAEQHAKTAIAVLSSVKVALKKSGLSKVTLVGHSLGAALALLDSVYLSVRLKGVKLRVIGYGMPRVGNQQFADYVERNVDVDRVNNKKDLVPIIPGVSLGFHHPKGEIHIQKNNQWVSCSGQDNTNSKCAAGAVKLLSTIVKGEIKDHSGPYDGVTMGC